MMRFFAAVLGLVWAGAAVGQTVVQGLSTAAQVSAPGPVINFGSPQFAGGARCDGSTDDSAAFNAATTYGKATLFANGIAPNYVVPMGKCVIQANGINLTGYFGNGFGFNLSGSGTGSTIYCKTTGVACIDALGSHYLNVYNLRITGDASSIPTIGLQIGRTQVDGGANNSSFVNVDFDGYYTFAPFYNFAGETDNYFNFQAYNHYSHGSSTTCFSIVMDGVNHWNVPSQYIATWTTGTDTYHSFNENTFDGVTAFADQGCTPVWMAGTRRHKWRGYVASFSSPYDVILFSDAVQTSPAVGDANFGLDMDTHDESGNVQYEYFITGPNNTPNLDGFRRRDHGSFATTSIFHADTNITSITMPDADLDFLGLNAGTVFAEPSLWNVSGRYYLPAGSNAWNLPCNSGWGGSGYVGLALPLICGNGSGVTNVTATTPSNLTASSLSNLGSINGIVVGSGSAAGHYNINSWCNNSQSSCLPQYAHLFPTCSLSGGGGTGGTCATSAVAVTNTALSAYQSGTNYVIPSAGGTGYAAGNHFTISNWSSYCTVEPVWNVQTISGSAVATYGFLTAGLCQTLPSEPISTTAVTGSGTGAQMSGLTWAVGAISYTPGSGYSSVPTVAIQPSNFNSGSNATATASINSLLGITAGCGSLTLNSMGTEAGTNGASGCPSISLGAMIDGSGVRQVLTGSNYTVPANTSLVRFTQTGTIASQTVILPTALYDGQPIQFVNYAGSLTAFTFSPVVNGWTGGSTLAAYTGLRVRWDSTSAAWYREQ